MTHPDTDRVMSEVRFSTLFSHGVSVLLQEEHQTGREERGLQFGLSS